MRRPRLLLTLFLAVGAALAAGNYLWAQAAPGTTHGRWEYHTEGWPTDEQLTKMGEQGWELVAVAVLEDRDTMSPAGKAAAGAAGASAPGTGGGAGDWVIQHKPNTRFFFKRSK